MKGVVMTERLDNLQDRNISTVFNILDSNQSGSITAEDFDLIGRRVCGHLGLAVDSDNGRKVCEGYKTWWNQLRKGLLAVSSGFGDQVAVGPAWRVDEEVRVSLGA
jgi:hypothetical protein